MNRADFDNYFALFNNRQYDEFIKYFADDLIYEMDPMNGKIFNGKHEFVKLYKNLHEYFDEDVKPGRIAFGDGMAAVDVKTLLRAKKEFKEEGFVPIPEGKTCHMLTFVHYYFNDEGKIGRIRVAIQYMENRDTIEGEVFNYV